MKTDNNLTFRAFTRQTFPTLDSAVRLLSFFVDAGERFTPTHYGPHEPIRTAFNPSDLVTPARLLSEPPRLLLLKRNDPELLAYISWKTQRTRPWLWTIRFGEKWLQPEIIGPAGLADFLFRLCAEFPPVFAACATEADWSRKHTIYEPDTHQDRGMKGMTLNPGEGLPGVYWFTFFGPELDAFFGRDRMTKLGVGRVLDGGESGVALTTYDHPSEQSPDWRRQREQRIMSALGADYFFDVSQGGSRTPIPDVTENQ